MCLVILIFHHKSVLENSVEIRGLVSSTLIDQIVACGFYQEHSDMEWGGAIIENYGAVTFNNGGTFGFAVVLSCHMK